LLGCLDPDPKGSEVPHPKSLHSCLDQLARLGGCLARAGDAPPGNIVLRKRLGNNVLLDLVSASSNAAMCFN
jgi:hypothetical protein